MSTDEPAETPLRRRVSWTAAAILGCGAVAIVLLVMRQDAASPSYLGVGSLDPSTWSSHADPEEGWFVRTPPRWHIQIGPKGHWCGTQIVVTNVDDDLRHPRLGFGRSTCLWDMRRMPRNFVVVAIDVPQDVVPGRSISQTPPLSFAAALPGSGAAQYGVPKGIWIPVWIDQGHVFIVRAWTGTSVSDHDRTIVERIVESIRSAA